MSCSTSKMIMFRRLTRQIAETRSHRKPSASRAWSIRTGAPPTGQAPDGWHQQCTTSSKRHSPMHRWTIKWGRISTRAPDTMGPRTDRTSCLALKADNSGLDRATLSTMNIRTTPCSTSTAVGSVIQTLENFKEPQWTKGLRTILPVQKNNDPVQGENVGIAGNFLENSLRYPNDDETGTYADPHWNGQIVSGACWGSAES